MTQAYSIEVYPAPPVKLFVSSGINEVLEGLEHFGYDYIAGPADEDDRTDEERKAAINFLMTVPGIANNYETE